MLNILGSRESQLTRRQILQVGGAGLAGMHFDQLLRAEAETQARAAKAKAVIFAFLYGVPSQLETFDVRPDAPTTIRGPFGTIQTKTPGLRFGEYLPNIAKISDQFALVRTLNHSENNHNGSHFIQTGQTLPPADRGSANVSATDTDWPAYGSVISYLDKKAAGSRGLEFPPYVYLPRLLGHFASYDINGQYAGWLGKPYNPMATHIRKNGPLDTPYFRPCDDKQLDFRPAGLNRWDDVSLDRLHKRQSLRAQLDNERRRLESARNVQSFGELRRQALDLLTSKDIASAFDVTLEDAKLRDEYGRDLFGQSLLLSRRLVERGARFVTVAWDMTVRGDDTTSWDSHRELTRVMRNHLLPGLDRSLPAFMLDMKQRGLLDDTLVMVAGEIGRTPRFLNRGSEDGRDHWSYCFPALFAGAGVQGGAIYGESDAHAAYPIADPVAPVDIAATIYERLGISPELRIPDAQGRPVPIADGGRVLKEIL